MHQNINTTSALTKGFSGNQLETVWKIAVKYLSLHACLIN